MRDILLKPDVIVTMDDRRRVLFGGALIVRDGIIQSVLTREELAAFPRIQGEVIECAGHTALPGFIQTHLHLCQTLFRGLADELELLDWLRLRIFPLEAAHTPASMYASAMLGIAELIRSGTTTILDMGSVLHEDAVVSALEETGLRAFVGKAMMDRNDVFPGLQEPTRAAVESTREQAKLWHGDGRGRIRYAVAPRFVLSCTEALLREAQAITEEFPGVLFHTHAAENRREMQAVRQQCGMDNVEYFASIGVLQTSTCLAHCCWLNDREVDLLAERHAHVLHCPSSNLKLASGIADVPRLLSRGISVSLGADGAPCNNSLDMFTEMRLAALIQKPAHGPSAVPAWQALELATRGGAEALGIAGEVGSLEAGKKADLVLLNLGHSWNNLLPDAYASIASSIVYSGSPENVTNVMIDGEWVYRNREFQTLDEPRITATGAEELRKILQRARLETV